MLILIVKKICIDIGIPWAVIGWPVNSISMATFLGTALPTATAGVEQNRPTLTLKPKSLQYFYFSKSCIHCIFRMALVLI